MVASKEKLMEPRYRWSLVAVVAIWLSVLVTSLFAPDFVSGSQQEHITVAAIANWLWGAIATVGILRALRTARTVDVRDGAWITLGLAVAVLWLVVAVVSIFAPVVETGSDPTQIPLAALLSPIVATLFTRYLAEFLVEVPVAETTKAKAETKPEAGEPPVQRRFEPQEDPGGGAPPEWAPGENDPGPQPDA
jgi:hypothetical protein